MQMWIKQTRPRVVSAFILQGKVGQRFESEVRKCPTSPPLSHHVISETRLTIAKITYMYGVAFRVMQDGYPASHFFSYILHIKAIYYIYYKLQRKQKEG